MENLNFFQNELDYKPCCQMMNCPMYISYRLGNDRFKENDDYIEFKFVPAQEIEE